MRTQKLPHELHHLCERLAYEYAMLRQVATLIRLTSPVDEINKVIRNSLIESFAVHVRTLYEFFWPSSQTIEILTDAVAADFYLTKDQLKKLARYKTRVLDQAYRQAGIQIATLSHLRFIEKDREITMWNFPSIVEDFDETMKFFLSSVSDIYLNFQMRTIKENLLG